MDIDRARELDDNDKIDHETFVCEGCSFEFPIEELVKCRNLWLCLYCSEGLLNE